MGTISDRYKRGRKTALKSISLRFSFRFSGARRGRDTEPAGCADDTAKVVRGRGRSRGGSDPVFGRPAAPNIASRK